MARYHRKSQRISKPKLKMPLFIAGGVALWIALLISPAGRVVAAVTILGIIGVLFILGCINIQGDDFRE